MQPGYVGEDQPQRSDLDKCTRCGLCEQACPTYRLLNFEPDSPRGRLFLMKEVAEGRAAVDAHLAEHLYRCLGCRACETACPSGVTFGKLLELGRHQVELLGDITPERSSYRLFRSLAFEHILPNPWLFRLTMFPARMLQSMPWLLRFIQALPLPSRLRQLVSMIPHATMRATASDLVIRSGEMYPALGERQARVGLFTGCVMGSLFSQVHAATIRVLTRNGCDVVVVPGQWCCGALNLHAGERHYARIMARRNVAAFHREQLDAIIVNSAGCGAVLKQYADLITDDLAGEHFAARVKDATEFLAEIGLRPGLQPVRKRVTYQDACHLAHGQRVRRQPRWLLTQVPGLNYVELPHADRCCGAAGVYSLTQPELSAQILAERLDEIAQTRADIVATTNPGCTIQLQAGLAARRATTEVCHVMELLDRSYGGGPLRGTPT